MWRDDLLRTATALGVEAHMGALEQYVDMFVGWNRRINLSAARTPDEVAVHVIDCMSLLPHAPTEGRLIDVGSGGGLPGCILAICNRHLRLTSLEPTHRKAAFQEKVSRELYIWMDIRTERADPELHHGFDVAVSRATFNLLEWLELGRRMVRPGGIVLGMEGREVRSLPQGAMRYPASHHDKTRSIIKLIA